MRILYLVLLLSFFALVGTAVAITRHIRRLSATAPSPPEAGLNSHDSSEILRPAQHSSSTSRERLDWAYFNKDSGDLNDPAIRSRPLRSVKPSSTPLKHRG